MLTVKGKGCGTLSEKLAKKFFHDIEVAQPLSQLPVRRCMKSVSFGTSTYLEIGGERSPSLSCYGNQKAEKLFNDVSEIARSLHVSNVPRSQGRELPAQNFARWGAIAFLINPPQKPDSGGLV